MKSITQSTIFLGCIISLIPYTYLNNDLGILLTIFFFGLTIILSNLGLEEKEK